MRLEYDEHFGKIIPPERIDLTTAEEFKEALQTLYERGYSTVVIDCSRLAIIDSAGLGNLIMFQKKLQERGGELRITNVDHRYIRHLFDMIELDRVIKIEEG
ncbi:MAG: STAS domain-containing protein [Dethiobacteria bacterium]|jgi:anti-sigma B factor antagonist